MRLEAGSAAMIRARLTHRIVADVAGRSGDALAIVEDGPLPAGSTIFVSGRLPCGECPACRRALCEACVGLRPLESFAAGERRDPRDVYDDVRDVQSIAVPERFITAIGEPLPASRAIAAGIVADVIGAAGRAGLGAGDTAIWMGEPAWTRVGASWSGGRGCRTFVFGPAAADSDMRPPPTPSSSSPAPQLLSPNAGPTAWREQIAETEAAGGPAGGRPERRIFVCAGDPALPALATAALDLVTPGTTLSFLRGAPATLRGLDSAPPLRIFTGGGGHPDLIPEALAALRRGEVEVDGLFLEIAPGDEDAAVAAYRRGTGRPVPIVAFAPMS